MEGRVEKKRTEQPGGPGLEHRTYYMLVESPQLHATEAVYTSKPFRGYR